MNNTVNQTAPELVLSIPYIIRENLKSNKKRKSFPYLAIFHNSLLIIVNAD